MGVLGVERFCEGEALIRFASGGPRSPTLSRKGPASGRGVCGLCFSVVIHAVYSHWRLISLCARQWGHE